MKKALPLVFLSACLALAATPSPAGTQITNQAYFDSLSDAGTPVSTPSNQVVLTVQQVPAYTLTPPSPAAAGPTPDLNGDPALICGQSVLASPGKQGVLRYTVTNSGNTPDTYSVTQTNYSAALPGPATWYVDDGNGLFDAADQQKSSVTLNPAESATLFAVVTVPATALSTDRLSLAPILSSSALGTSTTGNHVGCLQVSQVLGLSFSPDRSGNASSPGSVTYQHTLTNTSNTTLRPGELTASQSGSWPVSYSVAGGPANPTLQAALAAWNQPLAPGQQVNVSVTVTVPANIAGGSSDTLTSSVTITPDAQRVAGEFTNTQSSPTSVTDLTTVLQGKPEITKSVLSCDLDAACSAPHPIPGNLIKPGEVVQYTLLATNTGNAGLKQPVVRDTLPTFVTALSYSTSTSGTTTGQVLYSLNGTTWTTTAPDITSLATGAAIYAGYDSNGDGTINDQDILPPSGSITVKFVVKVN